MTESLDRLYDLLPFVYRQRDALQGGPLRALLQVIAEQVGVVEDDIDQLYDNWFIETCQDWVVPYIGDLVGYTPVHEAGEPGDVRTPRERQLNKILIPRRAVANTIRYRRRKGTLALLELLANDVAGWPARAVEFYTLLGTTQPINHLRLGRGRTIDVRHGDALERLDGPFDELAHTVDVRRVNSEYSQGRYNIPSVGVFVWRLKEYPVTKAPACCLEEIAPHWFTFSVLGNDTPLYARTRPEPDPTHIAEEDNLPVPIRRRAFERNVKRFYGEGKSLQIWIGKRKGANIVREYVEPARIVAADLSDWKKYRTRKGFVAVDPVRGRILFPIGGKQPAGVWVSYYYGFSADIGGGEYNRPILHPFEPTDAPDQKEGFAFYRVGERETLATIEDALKRWDKVKAERPHAVIEIADNSVYTEQINITLNKGQSLQIRAANRTHPTLYLLDRQKNRPDALTVTTVECKDDTGNPQECGGGFSLDGLLITGRGVHIEGKLDEVSIRHCTLVPGWALHNDCEPKRPTEPSLELYRTNARCNIEHSILGSIRVYHDNVLDDPLPLHISDSILDATNAESEALSDFEGSIAHTVLTIERSTVIGTLLTHAIELAEDCICTSLVMVARRQIGCMRFCYVPPDSRTPRRYQCQPDLVEQPIKNQASWKALTNAEKTQALEPERLRVQPQFNSTRYGTPAYCQLADACAIEIKRGASDQSEMGVFHDLYQPQREANLRVRLNEYAPTGMNAGIIFAS
jgi:hypothetical protein